MDFRLVAGFGALISAAAGAVAMMGLILKIPVLASLGPDMIPMAPSTAVLFLLYGVAVFLRAYRPSSLVVRRIGALTCTIGTVVALALFFLSYNNIHLPAEHLGIAIQGDVAGAPRGHMSPLTAVCFIMTGLSYAASLMPLADRPVQLTVAWWAACLLLSTSFVLLLAYFYGTPLLYHSGYIPPAATTSIAFLTIGASLLALAAPESRQGGELSAAYSRSLHILLAVFLILAVGIVTAGYLYYRRQSGNYKSEVERQLTAIADLKAYELARWRAERIADGAIFFKNENFSDLMQRYLATTADPRVKKRLRLWMQRVQAAYGYSQVFFLDRSGTVRLSIPGPPTKIGSRLKKAIPAALDSDEVTLIDLYRDLPGGHVRMEVLAPILATSKQDPPLGLLVLSIDPEDYLFPFLQSWPGPSHTAATFLVRRENGNVIFLNASGFSQGGALSQGISMADKPDLPAVQAVQGAQGIVTGADYRGVPVIAALRRIPASPWFLVTRMEMAEVFAPLRERMWVMIVLVGSLIVGAAAGVGLIWRRQRTLFYREQYQAADRVRVLSERQQAILAAVPDILMETDGQQVYTWANAPGLAFFGDDAIGRPAAFYGVETTKDNPPASTGEVTCFENWQRRKDGQKRLLAWRSQILTDDTGKVTGRLASARDITEQKQAEAQLQQTNDELIRFTYTVSHDLKSPLVTIRTFLGYLEKDMRGQDAAAVEKDLEYIRTAAGRMSRLLDELLELSRIGRLVNAPVTIPLKRVVQEALDNVAGRIADRGVQVQVTPQPVVLHGDRPRLVELYQNLIDNAVKFMGDQASPCIEIGVQPNGTEAVLFVRDNGVGIDPRHQSKIFDLFEKTDPSSEGTGIGLALVRRIVEVHEGRIWLESAGPGMGCAFLFTLADTAIKAT